MMTTQTWLQFILRESEANVITIYPAVFKTLKTTITVVESFSQGPRNEISRQSMLQLLRYFSLR